MTVVAALDTGGTKTAAALVDGDGRLLHRRTVPTPAGAGPAAVLDAAAVAEAAAAGGPYAAAGAGEGGSAVGGGPAVVAERAAAGDAVAVAVLEEGAVALGEAVGGLVNALDPGLVLVTGGVSRCGPAWRRPLRAAIAATTLPMLSDVPVAPGALGEDAALLGAAGLALETIA
ncbi:ROK family protein [Streptomyces sp. MAR4 CNY-716]